MNGGHTLQPYARKKCYVNKIAKTQPNSKRSQITNTNFLINLPDQVVPSGNIKK